MQRLETTLRKEISISNVVCTADLKQSVDIASFNEFKHLSSDLDLYSCGYVKDDTMVGRVSVFASGKLISVGTKSPNQAFSELKKASKILQMHKLTKPAKIVPKVRNIVARVDLGKTIPLERLAKTVPKSMYEPEQFPGLIYRIMGSRVGLIFASGKVVLVGSKSLEELNEACFEVKERFF